MTTNTICSIVAALAVASLAASALACDRVYQASLSTLPPLQGWTFHGSAVANSSAASGTLTYGPTTSSGTTYWSADLSGGGMDFSLVTWSLTANVRLTNSTFGNVSGFRRGGFVLSLSDKAGRWIIADIGSGALGLRNDNNGTSDPQTNLNLGDGFHQVTLEAGPGGGRLLVDGNQIQTLPLAAGGGAVDAGFGDESILASAQLTEIKWVTLVPSVDTCPGDLNCDVLVDDQDFSIFVQAYNVLVCDDPAMPPSCPADFNNDGLVDDADFAIFVVAYNRLVCE